MKEDNRGVEWFGGAGVYWYIGDGFAYHYVVTKGRGAKADCALERFEFSDDGYRQARAYLREHYGVAPDAEPERSQIKTPAHTR